MASLISKYAEAIANKDGLAKKTLFYFLPQIIFFFLNRITAELSQLPTQRQMVVKMAGERALKGAITEYENLLTKLKTALPVSEEELAEAHKIGYEGAIKIFKQETLMNEDDPMDKYQLYFFSFKKGKIEYIF